MSLYGLDHKQFRLNIVRPVLQRLLLWSPAAENLVLGTALHESRLTYVRQIGAGPAMGLWQMEPATHADIFENYLRYDASLKRKAIMLASFFSAEIPDPSELIGNNFYACAMARIHYRRAKRALPAADDALGLAEYWKDFYNTRRGRGTVDAALPHFQFAVSESEL